MVIKLNLPCGLYQPHADTEQRKREKFYALRTVIEMIYDNMITLPTRITEAFVVQYKIYKNHELHAALLKFLYF